MSKKYPMEFKLKLVSEYLSGQDKPNPVSLAGVSEQYGVRRTVLHRWVHSYKKSGYEGLMDASGKATGNGKGRPPKNPDSPEEIIARQGAEIDLLKKLLERVRGS